MSNTGLYFCDETDNTASLQERTPTARVECACVSLANNDGKMSLNKSDCTVIDRKGKHVKYDGDTERCFIGTEKEALNYCKHPTGGTTPTPRGGCAASTTAHVSCCDAYSGDYKSCTDDTNDASMEADIACEKEDGPFPACDQPYHPRPSPRPSPRPGHTQWTQSLYDSMIKSMKKAINSSVTNKKEKILCMAHKISNNVSPAEFLLTGDHKRVISLMMECVDTGDIPGDGVGGEEYNKVSSPPPGIEDNKLVVVPSPGKSPSPSPETGSSTMSTGAIVGIIAGGVVFVGVVIAVAAYFNGIDSRRPRKKGKKGKKKGKKK